MYGLKLVAVLAMALALSACDETAGGFSSASGQGIYSSPGYYPPAPYAQGPFVQPGYPLPYAQPGYGGPYVYDYGGRGEDVRREHEWHERQEHGFEHEDRQPYGQRPAPGNVPPMAAQPRGFAPAGPPQRLAAPPPPAATPQAAQNQKLLNQLGFQPSR